MAFENVAKLKDMLKSGWKMNSVSFSYVSGQLKVHVVLEKEGQKTFMDATNDVDFTTYVAHFKKFEDNYGNFEFVYVEDLKEYQRKIDELIQKGSVPKRPYKISIGHTDLTDVHLDHLLVAGPGGVHVGVASFLVPLDKNPAFQKVDFRDEVTITWTDDGQTAFKGYPHEVSCSGTAAVLLCYGGTRRLFQARLTSESVGARPVDLLYLLAVLSGHKAEFHGTMQPELSPRSFKVVFPIRNLVIPCDFRIEHVLFTKDICNELSDIVRKARSLSSSPWNGVSAFAVTNVESTHFFEALMNAEKIVKRAVDWIQFRTDISFPSFEENGKKIMLDYNLNKSDSKCSLIPYGLAIDSKTGGAVFLLLSAQSGHELVFKHDPSVFFEPLAAVWEKLEQLSNVTSNVQSIYQALSWFMEPFEVESLIDNLLQLWTAFEFICSGQKVPPSVEETSIEKSISSVKALRLSETEEMTIIRNIRQANNPALMVKWEHMIRRLGITLNAREQYLIFRLRVERNRIIHGKDARNLSVEDLEKFRSILERVFIVKVTKLIDSHYGIPDLSKLFG